MYRLKILFLSFVLISFNISSNDDIETFKKSNEFKEINNSVKHQIFAPGKRNKKIEEIGKIKDSELINTYKALKSDKNPDYESLSLISDAFVEKYPNNPEFSNMSLESAKNHAIVDEFKDEAITRLSKILKDHPNSKEKDSANAYWEALTDIKSIEGLLAANELIEAYFDGVKDLTKTYLIAGKIQSCKDKDFVKNYLEDTTVSDIDKANLEYNLSYAMYQNGKQRDALIQAEKVLTKYPNVRQARDKALCMAGYTCIMLRENDKAINYLNELIKSGEDKEAIIKGYSFLGLAYEHENDINMAINIYKEVVGRFPDSQQAQEISLEMNKLMN